MKLDEVRKRAFAMPLRAQLFRRDRTGSSTASI
jgi:hypothetical protein